MAAIAHIRFQFQTLDALSSLLSRSVDRNAFTVIFHIQPQFQAVVRAYILKQIREVSVKHQSHRARVGTTSPV